MKTNLVLVSANGKDLERENAVAAKDIIKTSSRPLTLVLRDDNMVRCGMEGRMMDGMDHAPMFDGMHSVMLYDEITCATACCLYSRYIDIKYQTCNGLNSS